MWERRTFHKCAEELSALSAEFRAAYANRGNFDQATRDGVLRDTSERGIEVLRILALSIRSDQDYGLTANTSASVGAIRNSVTAEDARALVRGYRPPHSRLPGFVPLKLRHALNKVAHANPRGTSFFADADTHDLILTGEERGSTWVAVISIIDLCKVIKSLPDARTQQ